MRGLLLVVLVVASVGCTAPAGPDDLADPPTVEDPDAARGVVADQTELAEPCLEHRLAGGGTFHLGAGESATGRLTWNGTFVSWDGEHYWQAADPVYEVRSALVLDRDGERIPLPSPRLTICARDAFCG